MNPQERRTKNRRAKLNPIWKSPEWKKFKQECIKDADGKCRWCGSTEALTPHHMLEYSYKHKWDYFDRRNIVVLCRRCHFAIHHGKVLCPKCGRIYMRYDKQCCFSCLSDAEKAELEERKETKLRREREWKERRRLKEKAFREKLKRDRALRSSSQK